MSAAMNQPRQSVALYCRPVASQINSAAGVTSEIPDPDPTQQAVDHPGCHDETSCEDISARDGHESLRAESREDELRERKRLLRDSQTGFALTADAFWNEDEEDTEFEESE